jgi:hypothetical protein
MPDYSRSQIPRMRDMTIAQQDEQIKRWRLRNALRTAYPEVVGAMMQWVIDSPDIDAFVAQGHQAHFNRLPEDDLIVRMVAAGYTSEEVVSAISQGEPPANWMSGEELASIANRIDNMLTYFKTHDHGTFNQALRIYADIGILARTEFIRQYGYAPEQSPTQNVRITGDRREKKKLKPTDHQPPLL